MINIGLVADAADVTAEEDASAVVAEVVLHAHGQVGGRGWEWEIILDWKSE